MCVCVCVSLCGVRADAHACVCHYASVCVCVCVRARVLSRSCVSTKVGLKIQIKKIGSQNTKKQSRKISMYGHIITVIRATCVRACLRWCVCRCVVCVCVCMRACVRARKCGRGVGGVRVCVRARDLFSFILPR